MSETTGRMSIGEFSRLTWLSPKALRLYEQRGLLVPDRVDAVTGYRSYRGDQADRARTIALLRRADMPLERIRTVLDADPASRRALLAEYRAEAVRAHERSMALLDELAETLAASAGGGADGAGATRPTPRVRTRDTLAQPYVSRTVPTTAAELPGHIERLSHALAARAGDDTDRTRPLVVVYHGEVGWESDGPIEVRVPVRTAGRADGVEPPGREVFVEVPLAAVQFPTILRAFDAVRVAAATDGRRPAGAPRELYLDGDPYRCEVAQPYTPTTS